MTPKEFYRGDLRAVLGVINQRGLMPSGEVTDRFGVEAVKCPFCFTPFPGIFMEGYHPHVICRWCGAEGPKAHQHGLEGALEAVLKWNNRVEPTVPQYHPLPVGPAFK